MNTLMSFSTPYYLFDKKGFMDNFNNLIGSMRKYYPRYRPAYSYKTNYTPYICGLAKDIGAYAEVVSDMELTLAYKLGYAPQNIIYNGPSKGEMMDAFLFQGGIVNIDNKVEAKRVIELAKRNLEKDIKVGLRINTDIGAGFTSRFGMDIEGGEIQEVVSEINSQRNLRLVGLHMHVSRARNIEAWQRRIDNMLYAADKYIQDVPEYLDLGSGMFADMEDFLRNQFVIKIPDYEEYARVVAGTMARHYEGSEILPILITEPGTTVVARYLSLITKVIGIKQIKDYRMAMVDSDYHQLGETGHMMKCPYSIFRTGNPSEAIQPPLNVVGFTCLEQDILFKDFPESLSIGDRIEFRNIGGYSIVYKPPFIQPQCPIYVNEEGEMKVIKRAETFNDIFHTFSFNE